MMQSGTNLPQFRPTGEYVLIKPIFVDYEILRPVNSPNEETGLGEVIEIGGRVTRCAKGDTVTIPGINNSSVGERVLYRVHQDHVEVVDAQH